ncbi:MAG TPA: hypothetical protein VIH82_06740, partial [Acidimicrobiia bacterium]
QGAVVYVPNVVEPSSLVGGLDAVAVPSMFTTDPTSGLQGEILEAYRDNGLLVRQDGFLFHQGLRPDAEDSWPDGVEGSFNYGVSYFQDHAGALAVNKAYEDTVLGTGDHQLKLPPELTRQGIVAFEPAAPRGAGLVTQIWFATKGNAFLAIAGTGKLPLGASRPDQLELFHTLEGALEREKPEPGPPLTETQAATDYTDAVKAVNDSAPAFRTDAAAWNGTTTNQQAVAAAQPLAQAFDAVESKLVTTAGRYPPARPQLLGTVANVAVLEADLADLARLDRIGVPAWLARYDTDLAHLTTASNQLRTTLGLPPTRS